MRKPTICIGENKAADQLRGNREADQRLFFATWIVQFLFYLNPKFQASSSFLSLYRPVCVGPGLNPKLLVFSCPRSIVQVYIKSSDIADCLSKNNAASSIQRQMLSETVRHSRTIQRIQHFFPGDKKIGFCGHYLVFVQYNLLALMLSSASVWRHSSAFVNCF